VHIHNAFMHLFRKLQAILKRFLMPQINTQTPDYAAAFAVSITLAFPSEKR
jgi:hypothetical protein